MSSISIAPGATPTPIITPRDLSFSAAAAIVRNVSDGTIFVSRSDDLTVEDGFPLEKGETLTIAKVSGDDRVPARGLYGVHAEGSPKEVRLLWL